MCHARIPRALRGGLRLLALSLLAWPALASAFEIEEQKRFDAIGVEVAVLKVISTADTDLFAPLIHSFQERNPGISVDYSEASSGEINKAILAGAGFDVAISSAMDLQTKLANDGHARSHRSAQTERLPAWANWRDTLFAFTQEPATIVVNPAHFEGLSIPRTRQELITLLRENQERFRGRIGTYDVRQSGLGYLFATQDSRASEGFWRLAEVMGGLRARLYCCSSDMIEDVASGRIAIAYNVLGSYAQARKDLADRIEIIEPEDFTTVMLRSVLIPSTAAAPEAAGAFVDHLLLAAWGGPEAATRAGYPFPPIDLSEQTARRPIRMGPGLLVYLDSLKRGRFLAEWEDAVLQE
ncbi:Bacterial extracellular solute-binding protein [Pseudoruegeria aquimaris]|uniref:Bacterial extracellular solute-binding protein n=1 Tax=Pseudoruegeria aquimaris TaxID=393663 RepID=A0A1Y5SL34_9RHOB|nr:ABC transporter substrate-binding protein [Pseudoruegeria aquimaris]SLN43114.1 Bacterial extracellular solute-binding protein [Pseudoruegeria aquimaris]